ncbi:uncharacterized protein [Macrobrachium rosenbergii]|uniref:uncharacterized protein isoform X1 n=1 Tax=Macrobrachium rosenbergii TaxID=79674 RepID=UPI0034D767D2
MPGSVASFEGQVREGDEEERESQESGVERSPGVPGKLASHVATHVLDFPRQTQACQAEQARDLLGHGRHRRGRGTGTVGGGGGPHRRHETRSHLLLIDRRGGTTAAAARVLPSSSSAAPASSSSSSCFLPSPPPASEYSTTGPNAKRLKYDAVEVQKMNSSSSPSSSSAFSSSSSEMEILKMIVNFQSARQEDEENEERLFCLSLVPSLKRLPLEKRSLAKLQIQKILHIMEFPDLKCDF